MHASEIELLPTKPNFQTSDSSSDGAPRFDTPSRRPHIRLPSWVLSSAKYVLYGLPLLIAITPVILLLAFAPVLSDRLGHNGCTSTGEFVFPYSSSIWNRSRFFAITIPFTLLRPGESNCRSGPGSTGIQSLDCDGNTFTHVKVMDIAWDVVVGRGGQAVLMLCAYRLFRRVIRMLMQQSEVGYDVFSAVAFNTGSLESFLALARHFVLGAAWHPIPRTRRTLWAYSGMAIATIYIIAMPSLIASMTGYTTHYAPFLDYSNSLEGPWWNNESDLGLQDCFGSLQPVWGRVQTLRDEKPLGPEKWVVTDSLITESVPIIAEGVPYASSYIAGPTWIDYYHRYRSVYDACPPKLNISDCAEANRTTYLLQPWEWDWTGLDNVTILPPMPGILPYQSASTPPSDITRWICALEEFQKSDLSRLRENDIPSAGLAVICRAGTGFVWGFSFLLTFMVCSMNLIFVLIMYALWVETLRHPVPSAAVSHFKDAAIMISSAQKEYGVDCTEWDAKDLKRIVPNPKFMNLPARPVSSKA
ncbi:hypothetical protein LTR37_018686 [Vermiconidia calcicola]|uniref:Uncharacterized protein n=1 Tax=Vermiconidia calcicola TaxID=1690605 RepID=A0ACC3MGK3_9PEZI|nr:hypothetical protein LTR37_018686 [Vermiconidia calcicola]